MTRMLLQAVTLVLLVCAGGGLFLLKIRAEARADSVAALTAQLMQKRQTVAILTADLAHLSSPAVVARSAATHLSLRPLRASRIRSSFADVAFRLDPDAPVDEERALLVRRVPHDGGQQGAVLAASYAVRDDHALLMDVLGLEQAITSHHGEGPP